MPSKIRNLTFRINEKQLAQLKAFGNTLDLPVEDFIKKMALLFTDNELQVDDLETSSEKKDLEDNMELMVEQLQKNQKFNDLLLRSIYSTQLRLEGQIKKYKKEASNELDKDFERISLMIKSMPVKQYEPVD